MAILEEFDECKASTFNPSEVEKRIEGFPKIGVTCFSKKLFDRVAAVFNYEEIGQTNNANGKSPIYKINYKGVDIALFMSRGRTRLLTRD